MNIQFPCDPHTAEYTHNHSARNFIDNLDAIFQCDSKTGVVIIDFIPTSLLYTSKDVSTCFFYGLHDFIPFPEN